MIKPQHMLVEERGLERQIKKIKDLINTKDDHVNGEYLLNIWVKTLNEIIKSLEDIKFSVKTENDRIIKDQLTTSDNKQLSFNFK